MYEDITELERKRLLGEDIEPEGMPWFNDTKENDKKYTNQNNRRFVVASIQRGNLDGSGVCGGLGGLRLRLVVQELGLLGCCAALVGWCLIIK